jgi:hypothetical protein
MYNTKYECRYYNNDVFLDSDDVTEDEKDFIRNVLYKEDLMNIFNIEEYDDFDVLNNILSELYQKVKDYTPLQNSMKTLADNLFISNIETGFCIFYSYDYMHIAHKCISEYLDRGTVSDENIKILDLLVNNS